MDTIITNIVNTLVKFSPTVHKSTSGSVYISFTDSKVKTIRFANHTGHKLKRNEWEVRTDVMTSRSKKNNNRIYNVNSINQLLKDFK
jgi:hypothetical protein